MTHMGRMGGNYEPPLTPKDKIIVTLVFIATMSGLGLVGWMLWSIFS